jgi:hypothetical protein
MNKHAISLDNACGQIAASLKPPISPESSLLHFADRADLTLRIRIGPESPCLEWMPTDCDEFDFSSCDHRRRATARVTQMPAFLFQLAGFAEQVASLAWRLPHYPILADSGCLR